MQHFGHVNTPFKTLFSYFFNFQIHVSKRRTENNVRMYAFCCHMYIPFHLHHRQKDLVGYRIPTEHQQAEWQNVYLFFIKYNALRKQLFCYLFSDKIICKDNYVCAVWVGDRRTQEMHTKWKLSLTLRKKLWGLGSKSEGIRAAVILNYFQTKYPPKRRVPTNPPTSLSTLLSPRMDRCWEGLRVTPNFHSWQLSYRLVSPKSE